jgi:hypothetical protein
MGWTYAKKLLSFAKFTNGGDDEGRSSSTACRPRARAGALSQAPPPIPTTDRSESLRPAFYTMRTNISPAWSKRPARPPIRAPLKRMYCRSLPTLTSIRSINWFMFHDFT